MVGRLELGELDLGPGVGEEGHRQDRDRRTEVAQELAELGAQVGLSPEARERDGHHRRAQGEQQREERRCLRDRRVLKGARQIVRGFADEDEADQRGEDLVGEAGEEADERARVRGREHQEKEAGPQTGAGRRR